MSSYIQSTQRESEVSTPQANRNEEQSTKTQSSIKNQHPSKQIEESHQQLLRNVKLVSVPFKEAALDSPSFRASINHCDVQIQNIEQWLGALILSMKKIPKHVKELQTFCNSFLEHLLPTFIQDGLIDQEYTVQSMQITLNDLKHLWGRSLEALNFESGLISKISTFRKMLASYKNLRRKFDSDQKKYDQYLGIFISTSKSKDPLMVMEDAKQLFQVRKDYIHSSLDLVMELQVASSRLDELFLNLMSDFWSTKISSYSHDNSLLEDRKKIERVQYWNEANSQAVKTLDGGMVSARRQVEEGYLLQFQPSMNANDYKSTLINNKTLYEIEENSVEKHGYLFMKTFVGKSSKPLWVKRWCFVKQGVFGMLVLSPSQTYVQESDKIGVLLCNVRYSPNEDRRFCFEVRTNELTLIFQAESLLEMKSWLKIFENEKQRVTTQSDDLSLKVASSKIPPLIYEFASTVNTAVDKELSNAKLVNNEGQTVTSSSLSSHIEHFGNFFEKYIYYQIPRIHPPLMTDTTKSSIIAYSLIPPTSIPTALTANIWGSLNWGLYNLIDTDEKIKSFDMKMVKYQQEHHGRDFFYPPFYPNEMVNMDIQMRALFDNAVNQGEYCVMSFGCIWSPNARQELSGRCFITTQHLYFYMQALGFVALHKGYIGKLMSVEYTLQKNFDSIKVYHVNGVINLKLFLDDGNMVSKKLTYLINNLVNDQPEALEQVFAAFSKIEAQVRTEIEDTKNLREINRLVKLLSDKKLVSDLYSNQGSIKPFVQDSKDHKVDFTDKYNLAAEKIYALPPKAIFHAVLGDKSIIFKDQSVFTTLKTYIRKPWTTENGLLVRNVKIPTTNGKSEVLISQVIDNMQDNQYYTFTHSKSKFQFFIGSPFTVVYKVVIIAYSSKKSKVFYYSRIEFDRKSMWNVFINAVCSRIDHNQVKKIDKKFNRVVNEVGRHGPIVKAIYLYGKLSQTDKPQQLETAKIINVSFLYATELLIKTMVRLIILYTKLGLILCGKILLIILNSLKMNQVWVLLVAILSLSNLFLIGRSTSTYWTVKRANKLAYDYVTHEPLMLQRSIYLKDLQDLMENNINHNGTSKPFEIFKQKSFIHNFKQDTSWKDYFSNDTRQVAKGLKNSFHDIGNKRHFLLVQLNILKKMEKDITEAEWVNWLLSETQRCDYLEKNILPQLDIEDKDYAIGTTNVLDYCSECKAALSAII